MSFLKNLFNDNSTIIGLCGFDMKKPNYKSSLANNDFYYNKLEAETIFETNFSTNTLLL